MEQKLISFIASNSKSRLDTHGHGLNFTHTFGHKNNNNFTMPINSIPEFLTMYCELAQEDQEKESKLEPFMLCKLGYNYGEMVNDSKLPLMINMTLNFNTESDEYYTETFLLKTVSIIQNVLVELIDVSPKLSEVICCVLETKPYQNKDNFTIRIRFHFPYCHIDNRYQKSVFKPALVSALRRERIFDYFETIPVNELDCILEDNKSVIPLYRSKDNPHGPPLSMTHIYNRVVEDDICGSNKADVELPFEQVFEPRNYSLVNSGFLKPDFLIDYLDSDNHARDFWMPVFLSINFWSKICRPKDTERDITSTVIDEEEDDMSPRYLARMLVPMLSPTRFELENSWLMIGNIIHKIFAGNDEGLELWAKYSNNTNMTSRTTDKCEARYRTFRGINKSIKTIGYMARNDDELSYSDFHETWRAVANRDALTGNDSDIKEALYRLLWLDYDFASDGGKDGEWLRFSGSRYKPGYQDLRRDIDEKFLPMFKDMRSEICSQSANVAKEGKRGEKLFSKEDERRNELMITKLNSLITKLGDEPKIRRIIKMAEVRFNNEDFNKHRDKNMNLMGVNNGVIECCGNKAYFREAFPEDYITKSNKLDYIDDYDDNSPLVKELMVFLRQVFPNIDILHFFLKDQAATIIGGNRDKYIRVWIGNTNASKSQCMKLHKLVFGEYTCDGVNSTITRTLKGFSGGPSPELMQLSSCKSCFYAELGRHDVLDGGKLKKVSGGDSFFARNNNKDGGSIENTVNPTIVINDLPDIMPTDQAIVERIAFIWFQSSFSFNAPESEEEQRRINVYPRNKNIDLRLPFLAPVFLWLLVKYYTIYIDEGLIPPKIMKDMMKKHWENTDYYNRFIVLKLEFVYENKEAKILDRNVSCTAEDLYPYFSRWFKAFYSSKILVDATEFKSEMSMNDRLGNPDVRGIWYGVRIMQNREE